MPSPRHEPEHGPRLQTAADLDRVVPRDPPKPPVLTLVGTGEGDDPDPFENETLEEHLARVYRANQIAIKQEVHRTEKKEFPHQTVLRLIKEIADQIGHKMGLVDD